MKMKMDKMQAITNAICAMTATRLNRVRVTWEEVEKIYASGEYPEINADIDYILYG